MTNNSQINLTDYVSRSVLQFLMSRDRDALMPVALALLDMSSLEGETGK